MLRVVYRSSIPPTAVMDLIRRGASNWRTSELPRELVDRGLNAIRMLESGRRFEFQLQRRWDIVPLSPYRFVGKVSEEGSGSRIDVSVGVFGHAREGSALFALIGLGVWLADAKGAWIAITIALGLLLWDSMRNHSLARGADEVVEYQFRLLEQALGVESPNLVRKD